MKAGIRTYLLADATLAAALATTGSVYSFPAPEGVAMPYLMLSRLSSVIQNLIGLSLDIYVENWQIDVITGPVAGGGDRAAEAIKELVIARMNIADRVEMGSYTVYSCSLVGVTDNTDLEMVGTETAVTRMTLEFQLLRDRTPTP